MCCDSLRGAKALRIFALCVALLGAGGAGANAGVGGESSVPDEAPAGAIHVPPLEPQNPGAEAPERPSAQAGRLIASGMASWYGGKFHGRKTANGERYDKNAFTAAHKTLPFGTRVLVKNVRNGKQVVVRINDRGPYARKRVIDLSSAAAAALGMKDRGVAKVELLRE